MADQEVPAPFKVAKVRAPMVSKGKANQLLLTSDLLKVGVQVVGDGGETNMHAHQADEAVWLVLDGEATFYGKDEDGEGERVVAKIGKHELLLIPRAVPYWFESSGDVPLVVVRFVAKDLTVAGTNRVDYSARRALPRELTGAVFGG